MALGKSIKMYLTIFVATTCMYMILYQYHISRQPMPQPEIIKHKDKSIAINGGGIINGYGGSYIPASSSSLNSASATLSLNSNNSNKNSKSALTLMSSHQQQQQQTSSLPLSFFTLPNRTTKLFKKMNLFLWSPMSLLSSSRAAKSPQSSATSSASSLTTSSTSSLSAAMRIASQKMQSSSSSYPAMAKANGAPASASAAASIASATVVDLNNTLLTSSTSTSSSSSSSSSTSSTTTTTSTTSSTSTTTTTTTTIPAAAASVKSSSTSSSSASSSLSSPSLSAAAAAAVRTHQDHNKNINNNKYYNNNNYRASSQSLMAKVDTPPLYIITPTYRRPEQLAELTRLGYTLKHVANLLWLVIEDANRTSEMVIQTLNRIGVPYEYFLAPMPEEYKSKKAKPRGVSNRNRGLSWLRENATEGVFYFADDDNTYDISIFEQMRYTKKVSMWPVGLVTKYGVSSPIVKNGKIVGFYDGWLGGRKYPVDMAGFAVSVRFLHERPKAKMPFKAGYEEDGFLKSLAPFENAEIELLANNCTEILTWHTQTKKNNAAEKLNMTKYGDTNLVFIDRALVRP
ncbi:galactosylgalactosylxylosylprotein 3-beta-glucuronosyltransferase P isoform X1 [Musca domestica]|uniref:Galactosylgalactosylxylosylprotein 3-beta-glucuronosyltransferase n=1 Tax=Musca domestica TaxID=7370 RepID=A0ABM3VIJ2_MUSDO|nr:galactosylgalactosylxylosylprotein 3-beta-glucuronosyltransferase P isoform X1 [Musca domestica]